MTSTEAAERLLRALAEVPGLRPAVPLLGGETAAVEIDPDRVRVRLVAMALPLPPLLDQATGLLRGALAGTAWEHLPLTLLVTDIDGTAFE
ncbi:hypothetical protein [Amycolatopsis suaedae]|uniref:Asp23/Gls24 family envelope stress response protein n=1 Tax=Amycolatopsis suaedae TaxID=2510978 RepID=A0A4Q7JF89_9PSEU|nr:hypothetical protein [Amycolatopsis suaedae]RZQ65194.1 hypothetical protein EWH70_04705 [Amycolatopsis suaedae]